MASVDFYQLSRDPVDRVVPLLAAKALEGGARVLVVHADATGRAALSEALWAREGAFLANGASGEPHADRQPILLAAECSAAKNGAGIAILADGAWGHEEARFERTILLFGGEQASQAQRLWRSLKDAGHSLRIFKQREDGVWREGA